ncbi:MAG: PEGA domain-containing protein [Bacteroides sp.]|nr:PEGA domain-containing protein [Bacteroides sp.]
MTRTTYRQAVAAVIFVMTALLTTFTAQGANLVVRNFKLLPTDQTAINAETMMKDQNGKTAALIKIYTNLNPQQTYFSNGVMGIVGRLNKNGQVWLYVPARSQRLEITNQKYQPLDYDFEEEILPGRTYSMELTVEGKEVTLSASVREAAVYVNGDSVGVSPLNIYLSYGEHAVKAEKGSMLYDDNILVTPDGPSRFVLQMEDENLKYSDVTVRVPDNADIYFQGRRVGVGEWHERLHAGHYSVELKKSNCEDRVKDFEVVAGKPTIIEAPAPVPFKGYLSVDVIPNTGTKIYDGDTIVAEHRLQKQLRVGNYSLTFRKKGYIPLIKTFTVERNKETTDTVILQRIQYIRSNAIYAGVGFNYGTISGVGAHVGGVISNFNIELGYTLGIGKSKEVYWFEAPKPDGLYDDHCTYSMDEFEVKAGYQFRFVERVGLTPQVGYLSQRLRGGVHGNGAMCHNLSIGARCVFNPHPTVGVFVNPEYAVPLQVNQLYKDIAEYGGFSKGGFYVSAGVTFNFGI